MKKSKAFFVSILVVSMLVIITFGLYVMNIKIWLAFAGLFVAGGIYFVWLKFYKWILDDAPLEAVYLEPFYDSQNKQFP